LNPTQTGAITNMARVAGAEFEFDVTDNTINSITQVALDTDLSLKITASADSAPTGNQVTYFLTVVNNGTNPAPNVVLTDRLPDTVNFVSANATQGACTNHNDGTVNCDFGLLSAGASAVAIVTVSPSGETNRRATERPCQIPCSASAIGGSGPLTPDLSA
jgi:uncharacterized repeat protein (TIGR01451 family)